ARPIATRATVAPSSVGGTSRRLRPKEPIAVRDAEVITTLVTCFLSLWARWRRRGRNPRLQRWLEASARTLAPVQESTADGLPAQGPSQFCCCRYTRGR